MRLFPWILAGWLLALPATAAAAWDFESTADPVVADLSRPVAGAFGLRLGAENLLLGRLERAALAPEGETPIETAEVAWRRNLTLAPNLRPFALAGLGLIGPTVDPVSLSLGGSAVEPQLRFVVGIDVHVFDGWWADAQLPVRWLAASDRTFVAATLGIRRMF